MKAERITVAITGASGAAYAIRLIDQLLIAGKEVYVLVSNPARVVLSHELNLTLPASPEAAKTALLSRLNRQSARLSVFGREQWMAPVASGSNAPDAMIVCPCSTGTLSAIAMGSCRSLLERAADVMLKEQRKLIIVPRETPFSTIHLENMLRLSRMGVTVLPASPAFYNNPSTINDLIDHVVGRILDHLGIANKLAARWGETNEQAD